MFALLSNNQNNIPTVVNVNSGDYVEKIMQGYVPIATGYRKDMDALKDELTPEYETDLLELNNEYN